LEEQDQEHINLSIELSKIKNELFESENQRIHYVNLMSI